MMTSINPTFRKSAARTTLALLFGVVLAGPAAIAQTAPAAQNAIYCREDLKDALAIDRAIFANVHQADGSLVFAMDVHGNNAVYSAYGQAVKVEDNHWRWTDTMPGPVACVMDIRLQEGTWTVAPTDDNLCALRRGERAPRTIPPFSPKFLITDVPAHVVNGPEEAHAGDNIQIMANAMATCADFKKPYTQSYTTGKLRKN